MERWELPQGWGWKKLEYKNKIFAGGPAPQKSEYYVNGQYPFVRVSDLGAMKRTDNLNTIRDYLNEQAIYDLHLVKAQRNTILFPKSGAAILTNNRALLGIDAFIVSHLAAVTPDMGFWNPKWVYYWMCTIDLKDFLQNPSYPSLKLETIRKIPIPLPYPDDPAHSLAEQRRIVARLEALLGEVRALREEVQSMRRDLAQVMESALAEAFPAPQGEVKEGWGWRKLKEIAREDSQQIIPTDYPEQEFNYWGLDTIAKNQIEEPSPNFVLGSTIQSTCVKFTKEHVLYCKLRPYLNKVVVPSLDGIGSTEWIPLKPNPEIIKRSFLAFFLRSPYFLQYATSNVAGARMPRMSKKALKEAFVPIPYPDDPARSLAEQRRIAAYLERIAEETRAMDDLLAQDLRDLDALEQSILAAVFRGEV